MAVYALYIPTARRPVSGVGLERFASRELTGRILLQRNNEQRSPTFYVGAAGTWRERPEEEFPLADETGYMRVFLRKAAHSIPGLLDTPDEEWVVREGGKRGVVQRLLWTEGQEELTIAEKRLKIVPAPPAPPPRELANRFFGSWLVLWGGGKGPDGDRLWECYCTCGTRALVPEEQLISGRSKRCAGCEPQPAYEVRTPTSTKPVTKACDACFMVPSVTGRCGCS